VVSGGRDGHRGPVFLRAMASMDPNDDTLSWMWLARDVSMITVNPVSFPLPVNQRMIFLVHRRSKKGHTSRMDSERQDATAAELGRELSGKENVGRLRLSIAGPWVVVLAVLLLAPDISIANRQLNELARVLGPTNRKVVIIQADGSDHVAITCHIHDPRTRARSSNLTEQQLREQKMSQMVRGELQFDATLVRLIRVKTHNPGIVDEDVNIVDGIVDLPPSFADRFKIVEVDRHKR